MKQDWLNDIQATHQSNKAMDGEHLNFDQFVDGLLDLAYVWTDDGLEDDPNA